MEEKDIPEETEETKTYGRGINAEKNKCTLMQILCLALAIL